MTKNKPKDSKLDRLRRRVAEVRTLERRLAAELALGRELRDSDPAEAQRRLEEVFSQTSLENHPAFHARAASSLSSLHSLRGNRSEQEQYARAAFESAQASGSRRGLAVAWTTLGNVHWYLAEHDKAQECYEQSLTLARASGYRHAERLAVTNLAAIAGVKGRLERALELYREGLKMDELAQDSRARAQSLYNIAWALDGLGRADGALEYLYRAVEAAEDHGEESIALMATGLLADLYAKRGDTARALQLYGEIAEAGRRLGMPDVLVPNLVEQGLVLVRNGDLAAGRAALEQALAACDRAGGRERTRPGVLVALAELSVVEGRLEDAARLLTQVEQATVRSGQRREQARALLVRAQLAARQDRSELAHELFAEATDALAAIGDNESLVRSRLAWARWLAGKGRTEPAARLLEQSAASARRLGATLLAEEASGLLFVIRAQTDRETALLDGLTGLTEMRLEPVTTLDRMCELVARTFDCCSAVVFLGSKPTAVYGKPDLGRVRRAARRRGSVPTALYLRFALTTGTSKRGTAWFEREPGSAAMPCPETADRIGHLLSTPLALVLQAQAERRPTTGAAAGGLRFRGVIGDNPAMLESLDLVGKLAQSSIPVLIRGESGTGKELAARALHDSGPRWDKPFVAVNCAAVPEGLLEAEFFGVEKGAATGVSERPGKFELAHHGTIFLDEIGDMSLELQARLLRVLEDKALTRVGGTREIKVDVRVVAATNRELKRLVRKALLREDLYYRLSGCEIVLPPLRERREDIPALARYFVDAACLATGRRPKQIAPGLVRALQDHDWPGNVRELQNVVERCVLTSRGETLEPDDLPRQVLAGTTGRRQTEPRPKTAPDHAAIIRAGRRAERQRLLGFLKQTGWNVRAAARLAGYGHTQFYRLLHKHNLPGARQRRHRH